MTSFDHIEVRGARQNNLAGVDLDIPKHELVLFTGVSGSGKSSLAFGTIAAESRRLINETYSAFAQGFMPTVARPEVDVLRGLTAAITVDQEQMGGDIRSTVGTATDADALLRILFSRLGEPHIGPPSAFSPNVPTVRASGAITVERGDRKREHVTFSRTGGMCPTCEGRGEVRDLDPDQVVDRSKSLNEGAVLAPLWNAGDAGELGLVDPDTKVEDYTDQEWDDLWSKPATKLEREDGSGTTYEGLSVRIHRTWLGERTPKQKAIVEFLDRAVTDQPCPDCGGTRLSEAARSVQLHGRGIADCSAMEVSELRDWLAEVDDAAVGPVVGNLADLLGSLVDIGLGYLSLDRVASTLSGGEAQRVKMVRHLGSPLSDVTYVFDEPTAGLHPHDVRSMVDLLGSLRDKGNTVLVVEHDPQVIVHADHVVDLGPGAGTSGGTVTYQGGVDGLRSSDTVTGRHLDRRTTLKNDVRTATDHLTIANANLHNLDDVTVDLPLGVVCVVTGVAGSGKTSLVHGCMPERDDVIVVDQSSIRGSRRSNAATYTGVLDTIRAAFARANDVSASLFSANSDGACPACKGLGVVHTDLGMLGEVSATCELCRGRRFTDDVLEHRYHGKDIAEVYDLPVDEALAFFDEAGLPSATETLQRLADVGLGYLSLGQPLNTLSGGERQRLKLAVHMAGEPSTYVLDEPTSGLHLADVEHLLGLLDRLVDDGNSVIVIEHHQAVMAHGDWIVDLGPGAGSDGGRVVFEGTPADLVADASTLTGEELADWVG
ncbi:ATP-binding cassette domain-containing protein [Salsipaludibacter albus]|uniref:ATP-binding cassette domain-containing protein n=1 Tax=Salsipaludibacter albus TaxID=2849650 RepID=UPI001EE43877|nr:excinuclease ABC subunit UvrA [Salsipaludibacter albus]MBY5161402.1 excinuclease ABC subunit UvrA [Salsipaludibacter albus]